MSHSSSLLHERVAILCDRSGVRERERLSLLCGLSGCHLRLVISSKQRTIRTDVAAKIAATFGCKLDWLINGEGRTPSARRVRASIERARERANSGPKEAA